MPFFTQFLAGSVTAGALTYLFHSTIVSRTNQLSLDLSELSSRLNSLTLSSTTSTTPLILPGTKSIPLKEAIKSKWNETLLESIHSVQNVNWSQVAHKGYKSVNEFTALVKSKLDS